MEQEVVQDKLEVNTPEWWEMKTRKYISKEDFRDRPKDYQALADLCLGTVLEVGSCFGAFSKYIPEDSPYVGIDISQHATNAARHRYPERAFLCGDFFRVGEHLQNTFDTVVGMQILEHFESPGNALRLLAMVARKRIVFSVPRGKPNENEHENEGHFSGWKDANEFTQFVIASLPQRDPCPVVKFVEGNERHMNGVILL